MAELADALDSGSSESNFMQVQVLFPAPDDKIRTQFSELEMGSDFFLPFATIILKTADGGALLPNANEIIVCKRNPDRAI